MLALLTTLHVLVAVVLILIVLLQSARGTDLAGAFGGMGSQTAFGPRGTATFLSKATVVLAGIFMVSSLALAILSNRARSGGESVLSGQETAAPQSQAAPAAPTGPAQPIPGVPGAKVQLEGLPTEVTVGAGQPGQPAAPGAQNPPAGPSQTNQPGAPAQGAAPSAPAQTPQPQAPAAPSPNP